MHFEFDDEAKSLLDAYHWPGNVRELRNYVEYWTNLNKTTISKWIFPFRRYGTWRKYI